MDMNFLIQATKNVETQNYTGVAKMVAAWATTQIVARKLAEDGLIDVEYAFESHAGMQQIPLFHKRMWDGNPCEETSFEMRFILTDEWESPIGDDSPDPLIEAYPKRS